MTPGSNLSNLETPQKDLDQENTPTPEVQLLCTIGITELLDQDDRPTFIIDITDSANFIAGSPLQIVFANTSLRGRGSLLELVSGNLSIDGPAYSVMSDFPAFKYWSLSFIQNGEPQDIPLPQFEYAKIFWTCNTLRKKLRLISGNTNMSSARVPISIYNRPFYSSNQINVQNLNKSDDRTRISNRCYPLIQSTKTLVNLEESTAPHWDCKDKVQNLLLSEETIDKLSSHANTAIVTNLKHTENLCFDWTRLPSSATLSRHIKFTRSIDWASTSLGPIENWNFNLRTMSNLVMCSPHPTAMYWGDNFTTIYNEAYILLAGQKHPKLMGQDYKEAWVEIWDEIEGTFKNAKDSGLSTMKEDDCLFIRRNGYLEESYFSWSIIPLVGEDGSVVGLYNPAFDKTRQKIAERRMLMLREVGEYTAAARGVKEFWGRVIKSLEPYEYDVPFAFLYSIRDDTESDISSIHSNSHSQFPQCILEGTLGASSNHPAALSPLDLKNSNETFVPYFREAMKVEKPIVLTTEDNTLSCAFIEGLESRGFGDPCRAVVVCPIRPTTEEITLGLLVIGTNPRRPFDDDYSLFIQLLSRQLATSLASVVLFQEEIKRSEQAAYLAALDRQNLSEQLDIRTREAVESETKFTRMAELAPVGMFIANSRGDVTYNNEMWWEISRHPRSENSADSWMDSINDEDRAEVEKSWKSLLENRTSVTLEFRFKAPWTDRNGCRSDTWVLMSAYPERSNEGDLKSVFGSITDISQQKWAEDLQKRRTEEAIEMKRQQENFIDMTSHEMRNPLSAILQCSDEISASLTVYKASKMCENTNHDLLTIIDSSIDASQTIALCAQHQKRIVDDILTLSKLDSALLMVTPVVVQPVSVIQQALKMFEGELGTNDIALEFEIKKSYLKLGIDRVKLDPSRLLQVLINLTTNAIKFTQSQSKRKITVSVGASMKPSNINIPEFSYFPSRSKRKDPTTDEFEWGDGEQIYLHFAVQDTGRGLDEGEKTLLFQRFSQASPRTHVQYGGSGLGLFISRELTELQGGEIGVASKPGVGSTFAFYIKARKAENIDYESQSITPLKIPRKKQLSNRKKLPSETRKKEAFTLINELNTTEPKSDTILDHSKIKVLIVEDNLVNQRVLQKQLTKQGFQTVLANHGGEVLNFLKKTTFWKGNELDGLELSVILMDLEMPLMDGLTCARLIRDAEVEGNIVRHVPLIAVTANARLEQIENALAAGMDDVQSKPFVIRDLIPKIEQLVK